MSQYAKYPAPIFTGTVTSVALSAPASILSVSGSPVTSSGSLALALVVQTANKVWSGPSTGADAAPTFRALVANDLPVVPVVKGGTGVSSLTAGSVLFSDGSVITQDNTNLFWDNVAKSLSMKSAILKGHIVSTQAVAPGIAADAGAGTGASVSITATSTDHVGQVSLTTGTLGLSTGSYATITFSSPYESAPIVVLTPAGAALSSSVYVTSTVNGFSINFAVAGGISTTYVINYMVVGVA